MYTADDYEEAILFLESHIRQAQDVYIRRLVRRLRAIEDADYIDMIAIMTAMFEDTRVIRAAVFDAMLRCSEDIPRIMENVVQDSLHDPSFERALAEAPEGTAEAISPQVEEMADEATKSLRTAFRGLTATTVVSRAYRDAVNRGIEAIRGKRAGYRQAVDKIIEDCGEQGLQVRYASGAVRRLDSAARMNVTNAINQLAMESNLRIGEELGYDAIELSAHADSAPDHEPVQGRVFLREEFDKMQAGDPATDIDGVTYDGFPRPIGEWNCRHLPFAFSTKYSVRTYTPAQLDDLRRRNAVGATIDGKHYSIYEIEQKMRRLETDIRRQKDRAKACEAAGDHDGQAKCQQRINALELRYGRTARAAGIRPRYKRTEVPGFHKIRV